MSPNPYNPPQDREPASETDPFRNVATKYACAVLSVVVGGLCGYLVWLASESVTGHPEPWDANGPYYFVSLVAAGFLSTLIYPRSVFLGASGVLVGQALYVILGMIADFPTMRSVMLNLPFALIPLVTMTAVPALGGGVLVYFGYRRIVEQKRRTNTRTNDSVK